MTGIPKPKEHEIQAQVVQCLKLAGLTVLETTAYRQKERAALILAFLTCWWLFLARLRFGSGSR